MSSTSNPTHWCPRDRWLHLGRLLGSAAAAIESVIAPRVDCRFGFSTGLVPALADSAPSPGLEL